MFVIPATAAPEKRWLAHLLRAAAGCIRSGDRFDDDLPLDAERVRALARRHRLSPVLYRGIADGRIADSLPEVLVEALRRDYYATLRKNVVALEIGGRVLRDIGMAGVPVAPLKGWALIDGKPRIYEDAGVRPMDDLDLIVSARDWERAAKVLGEHGFEAISGRRAARLAAGHEMAFHRRMAGVNLFIELHWSWAGSESLMRGFGLTGERFLSELCLLPGEVGASFTPTPVGHLLFLAVHAARHAFSRWIWLLDLHRLITGTRPDWDEVLQAARRYRSSRPLYAGLAASRELLRSPVPKEVLAELAPGPVRRSLLRRSLVASGEAPGPRPERVAKLLLGESWWDVARTAAWAAAPGRSWYAKRGEAAGLADRLRHPARVLAGRTGGDS